MFDNIEYAALTDVGRERSENQDNYGEARLDRFEFFYVCDGMGGHAGGSTASQLGVDTIRSVLQSDNSDARERLANAIHAANDAIFERQVHQRNLRGMGTTVVAIAVDKKEHVAHFAHVGDSRAYRLRGQTFRRLTRDHTMVQRLVDDGVISPEEAENHPNSNVISRSLGGYPEVEVEHGPEPLELQHGDTFLLCSDGLSGLVSEAEMASWLVELEPEDAAAKLVERANEQGGHDNITVEVVRIGGKPSTNPSEPIAIEHPPRGPSSRELMEAEREAAEAFLATPTPADADVPGKVGETITLDMNQLASGAEATEEGKSGAAVRHRRSRPVPQISDSEREFRKQRERLILIIFGLLIVFLALLIALLLRIGSQAGQPEPSSSVQSTTHQAAVLFDDVGTHPRS